MTLSSRTEARNPLIDGGITQPFQIGDKVHVVSGGDWPGHEIHYVVGIVLTEAGDFDIWIADRFPPERGDITDGFAASDLASA